MSEIQPGMTGIVQGELPIPVQQNIDTYQGAAQSENYDESSGQKPNRLLAMATAITAVGTLIVGGAVNSPPAQAATAKYAEVKMPGNGKWGSTASGQASEHTIHGNGQHAQDLFLGVGTSVVLDVAAPNGEEVTFDLLTTWNSCGGDAGKGIRLAVKVANEKVGEVEFAHLDDMVTEGPITNGMTLGKTKKWPYKKYCWEVTTDAGVHVHYEATSDSNNHACYYDRAVTSEVSQGTAIARLGKTAATAIQQACTESPGGGGGGEEPPYTPADFNRDRKADLIWYEQWKNTISLLRSTGGSFDIVPLMSGVGGPDWAGVGDFDGNKFADLAWYERWQNKITILINHGNGVFTPHVWRSDIGGPDWAKVGDFDGDGKDDIAWFEQWQNKVSLLHSNGSAFEVRAGMDGIGGPDWAGVGDFNGDGKHDIAWYERWKQAITVFESRQPGGGFAPREYRSGIGGPDWAQVGDFDGDNRNDIAWYERWQAAITVLESQGGNFTPRRYLSGVGGPDWAGGR